MLLAKTLQFYKRNDVREAILEHAASKEVSVKFGSYFGKRPEAFYTIGDILDFAKQKASSFHCSEELWDNPLFIKTGMGRKEIADLRTGWDLILDIDCPYWPLSKLITHLFVKALSAHGIMNIGVKFSGNKGFHIGVPFESFPESFQGSLTKDLFPEAPRRIAYYLLDYMAKRYVVEQGDFLVFDKKYRISKQKLALAFGKDISSFVKELVLGDGTKVKQFDPLEVIEVDTVLIAHRHLYRMPYSFHEKSGLVSVPIAKNGILKFAKKDAAFDKVTLDHVFLDRNASESGEATKLLIAAYDFNPQFAKDEVKVKKEYEIPAEALPKDVFPPCIKNMLNGLKDGKKRSLFTLINFLKGCGWSHEQIEEELYAWNKRHEEPLREVVLKGQLRYAKIRKDAAPPHNCKRYYQDMGVCTPDAFCARVKNPLQYAKLKGEQLISGKKGRKKLTAEQKEMRKKFRDKKKANKGKE